MRLILPYSWKAAFESRVSWAARRAALASSFLGTIFWWKCRVQRRVIDSNAAMGLVTYYYLQQAPCPITWQKNHRFLAWEQRQLGREIHSTYISTIAFDPGWAFQRLHQLEKDDDAHGGSEDDSDGQEQKKRRSNISSFFYDKPIVGNDVPGRGFAVFDTLIIES